MRLLKGWGVYGVICLPAFAQGVIDTIAGTDWFFPGNGRPAIASPLGRVQRIAIGRDGTLYIADPDNNMVFKVLGDGTLTIVAGNGKAGFSGDNGPATLAALNQPTGVTADAAGNIYIADNGNNRIRTVPASGVISTVAGTGDYRFNGDNLPATLAALNSPTDVAVDSAGNIYVCELVGNRVRRVSAMTGIISTAAGTGTAGFSGDGGPASAAMLNEPIGLFIDTKDQIYIADSRRIRRIGVGGVIQTVAGISDYLPVQDGIPATQASLASPAAVAVDATGVVYIADSGVSLVRKVGLDGIIRTVAGTGVAGFLDGTVATKAELNQPSGIAVDANTVLYIGDTLNSRVRKVSSSGVITTIAGNGMYKFGGDGGPASAGLLNQPGDVAIDSHGNIYISDSLNHRVRRIDATGAISTIAGNGIAGFSGDGGTATRASLDKPIGLALDSSGNLFIADYNNNRVRKVSTSGAITTAVGGGNQGDGAPATQAALQYPEFLAFDSSGNLYITEMQSFRVRKVTPNGIFTTFAGNGSSDSSGDGGKAIDAGISYSGGITADSKGNVYFTEIFNGRVRKVTPDGNISTYAGNGGSCCSGAGGLAVQASLDTTGLAVDNTGNLFVTGGPLLWKITPDSTISIIAGGGNPPSGSIGDGGSALDATLSGVTGVRVDPFGNVLLADTLDDRIRQVLNVQPPFDVSPKTLTFTAQSNGAASVAQSLLVASSVTNLAYTVTGATGNGDWLSVTPASGLAPGVIQVSADPSHLPPGDYEATVSVNAPDAFPSLVVVDVKFSVTPASAPTLAAEPDSLEFDFVAGLPGGSHPLVVRNVGSGTLPFGLSATTTTGGNWLSVSPASGSAAVSTPSIATVTANPGKLPPGTYAGLISVQSAPSKQQVFVPVTMTVHSTAQTIVLSQSGLTISAVAGTTATQQQSFEVLNPGLGALNWSAASSTLSGGNKWLSVSPPTGASGPGGTSPGEVDVTVNPSGLAAGDYYGQVTITSPGAANSPQVLSVVLTIAPLGTLSVPDVRPTGLVFVSTANGPIAPQEFVITNTSGSANSFRSTRGAAFFSYQPTTGSLPPGQPVPISVQPNLQGEGPGVQRGSITLQFADGSTRLVAVLLVVPGSAAASAVGHAQSSHVSGCQASNLNLVFTLLGQGFQAPASWPAAIEVKVVDNCGVFLDTGSVTVSFSNGDSPLALVPVGQGTWSGTWQPGNSASPISVTATAQNANGSLRGSVVITGATAPNPSIPVITSASVVSAASLRPHAPLSPGGLISIFGQNLSTGAAESGLPLQLLLNGTSAIIGGAALPLLYVSAKQMNAMIPYDVPINTTVQLVIQNNSSLTVPMPVSVAPAQPAVFTVNQNGKGQGYIFGPNSRLADANNPVRSGDTVTIFCAGLGAVDQPILPGSPAPANPLARTTSPVTATVSGTAANVTFAGLAPGYVGLYQVNAVVPEGVTPGNAVNLILTVAGQVSPPVTMAVQ